MKKKALFLDRDGVVNKEKNYVRKIEDFHLDIDLANSILVGDKALDIEAGLNAGVGRNYLVRSGHEVDARSTKALKVLDGIRDLLDEI